MKSILGMGNALVDILAVTKDDTLLEKYKLPKGSMQHVDEQTANSVYEELKHIGSSVVTGGSAANTIAGISQLGLKTGFLGKVGNDELGDFYENDLKSLNIKSLLLRGLKGTGRAMVVISPDSERTFAVYLGSAIELSSKDIHPTVFDDYDYFHIEGYLIQDHNLIETAVKTANLKNKLISLDLASYNVVAENLDFLRNIVQYANIVFANEEEAKSFTGKDAEEALDIIAEMCDIAVVKVGAKGSLVKQGGNVYKIAATDCKPIDLTGAGDLYASGFLYGLSLGKDIETCAKMGTICAGEIIKVIGTKLSADSWNNLREQVAKL
ncbi:MAG: adenosine kinase [Prevotellaceae bacterium]|jgi:sugar/nucleoside kinase (ribokinase family)|nr:adenosine kinase [Prevotellaceae bacterium]